LRLHLGELPAGGLGWGLLGAAALPLVVGRRWRGAWAARLWFVAVVAWVVAGAAGRGWLGVSPPALDVLLAPAAVALVLCAALGLSAFEADLPGYRFGWRQVASLAAAVAAVAATVPIVATAVDGRWRMPSRDFQGLLSWMPEEVGKGDFRVLWLGAPDSLPLDGWRLTDGLAYGTSRNGVPDATSLWPGSDDGATGLLADALGVARRGETTRLGRILGPHGVRYIAVPLRPAPSSRASAGHPPPVGVLDALRGQVDLELVQTDDSLVLFENASWTPIKSIGNAQTLQPGSPVLRSRGPVAAGTVVVAESYSPRWRLTVDGDAVPHGKAGGWANSFTVAAAGTGRLVYRTPPLRYAVLLLQLALWVAAVRLVLRAQRTRTRVVAAADAAADDAAADDALADVVVEDAP
ncbi:MAG TPA: hypothetical protein VF230_11050, partial [Acidimicrobiales bacterium]